MKLGGTQKYRPIESIGQKIPNPDGSPDSVFKQVGDFAFRTQTGDSLTSKMVKGKIWIVNLFYGNCTEVCDMLHDYVRQMLTKDFPNDPEIVFLSLSLDPAQDSLPVLRAYAERMKAMNDRWYFLAGDSERTKKFLTEELLYPAYDGQFATTKGLYDRTFRLVDWNGNLRGQFYDGNSEPNMVTMAQHVVLLLKEFDDLQVVGGSQNK